MYAKNNSNIAQDISIIIFAPIIVPAFCHNRMIEFLMAPYNPEIAQPVRGVILTCAAPDKSEPI